MRYNQLFLTIIFTLSIFFIPLTSSLAQLPAEKMLEKLMREEAAPPLTPARVSQYDVDTENQIKKTQQAINYTSDELRDPFSLTVPQGAITIRPSVTAQPLPKFKIEGYVWGSSLPQAIIDGAVYSVGDSVQGAQITNIDKDGITFLYGGNIYKVK